MSTNKKGPAVQQGLSVFKLHSWLAGLYLRRTRAFLAFADFKLDLLAFIQRCIAGCLNIRVVDKQVIPTVIRTDKTISLT
jgi:hypothetical protein